MLRRRDLTMLEREAEIKAVQEAMRRNQAAFLKSQEDAFETQSEERAASPTKTKQPLRQRAHSRPLHQSAVHVSNVT